MVGAGALSGLFSAGTLAVINKALYRAEGQSLMLLAAFAALVVGKIATNGLSQILLVRFAQDTVLEFSLAICSKILKAPLRLLEKKGPGKILTTLTDDVSTVAWALQCLPQLAMNAAVMLGCGLYLAWLSWVTFLGVVMVTILGALGYQLLHRRAFEVIYSAREARSKLFGHFRTLTDGIKELLMHRKRGREFINQEVRSTADELRRYNLAATTHYAVADGWTQGLFYTLIGLLLFVFADTAKLPPESLTGYVFAILYMMNPIWGIIGTLPAVSRGQISLEKLEELGVSLESFKDEPETILVPQGEKGRDPWVQLNGVLFQYDGDAAKDMGFALGPINFELQPGEIVFIIGGNGSGKSTFVKVLTGLYTPKQGEVRLGRKVITPADVGWYREHFSVVFSDFFLFDKLLGFGGRDIEAAGREYLRLLQIDQKVSLTGQTFSTINLSQGQRKRLALVTAYLEDRPFYVFDEWAADQDPHYKEIFYHRLLPDLCRRGKAVVVITHDDRYFHLGDRVVKLEDGMIVDSWNPRLDRAAHLGS